jgi:hypothetical protein
MKKSIYLAAAATLLLSGCQSPEYVAPTVERQGITSLTAIFTDGPYEDKEIVNYAITDPLSEEYVIPIPWFYPETSDDETEQYMTSFRVKAEIANNCIISPALTILDLNKSNYFTFTSPDGSKRQICIRGERVKSDQCEIKTFDIIDPELSGVIDNDNNTISIISADDLSEVNADYSLSAHATISPDPKTTKLNLNEPVQLTVTAHNGTTSKTYTVKKEVPDKIAYGYRSGSETNLFGFDLQTLGFDWVSTNYFSMGVIGNYLVVCQGNGSTPTYLNRITGAVLGKVNTGSVTVSSITSDLNGNLVMATTAASGAEFKLYKTRSVETAPELLLTYTNATGHILGQRVQIQGSLDGDAQIIATCEGTWAARATKVVRWIVKGGVIGEPEIVAFTGIGTGWRNVPTNTKVVSTGVTGTEPYFLSYYSDNTLYWVDASSLAAAATVTANSSLSGNMNDNCLDARVFNNAPYVVLFCPSHFPHWGTHASLFMFDVMNQSNFSGSLLNSPAIVFSQSNSIYINSSQAAPNASGDVFLYTTSDGYKMYLYYIDNSTRILGAYGFDCIDK